MSREPNNQLIIPVTIRGITPLCEKVTELLNDNPEYKLENVFTVYTRIVKEKYDPGVDNEYDYYDILEVTAIVVLSKL